MPFFHIVSDNLDLKTKNFLRLFFSLLSPLSLQLMSYMFSWIIIIISSSSISYHILCFMILIHCYFLVLINK